MQPIYLSETAADQLINALPAGFKQARRMVAHLGQHPGSPTAAVAAQCSVGNLSDIARKANKFIAPHGVMISCQRPPVPIQNRFGEPSGMFFWGLYQVQSANDGLSEGANNDSAS